MVEKNTDSTERKKHTLQLTARQRLCLAGVTDVRSFDEEQIELLTDCGSLTVEGEGLHIGTLDIAGGAVEVQGNVCALYYSDVAPGGRERRRRR